MSDSNTQGLSSLGLNGAEERVYRALIEIGAMSPRALADRLDISLDVAVRLLRTLESVGLTAPTASDRARYIAAPPQMALRAMVHRRREELHQAERAVAELTEIYRGTANGRVAGDLIEVLTGAEVTAQRFQQLKVGAEEEVLAFVTNAPMVVTPDDNGRESEAIERGVRHRALIDQDVLERPGGLKRLEGPVKRGEEIRVTPGLPVNLIVADRRVALVPLTSYAVEPGAVVVHPSGLLDALISLFEALWARALPIGGETSQRVLDPLDRHILVLLLAGLTDDSVAEQAGVSVRTVQRRIRHLMEVAGVTTRLQLGWYAAQHEWT